MINSSLKKNDEAYMTLQWNNAVLTLLDQRQLPQKCVYLDYDSATAVAKAIKEMVVRGAPAIGIAAAYAVVLAARAAYRSSKHNWHRTIEKELAVLSSARPTAINLNQAINKMRMVFKSIEANPEPVLLELAMEMHNQDIAANHEMGRLGCSLIMPGSKVVTHCNAGALATAGYGTALGVIRTAYKQGLIKQVYCSETRPWMQGARLTSWELGQNNIPTKLVIDSYVATLMKTEAVDWLIVGADRIAANGDVANKIGTYSHVVSAKHHAVNVMVVAPFSTIDMQTKSGKDIPIEYRDPEEISHFNNIQIAANEVEAVNPVFDITPADMIDVIVTERGIIRQPNSKKMLAKFR